MVYEDFKDLSRKAACDKVLCDKAVNTKNPKYDGYQRGLPSMIDNFFDKQSSGGAVKSEIISKQQLAKELHKLIVRTFEK